jgi:hypothetical protein
MEWRLRRLTELGFEAGIWNWQAHDLAMLEKSCAAFSSMTGYLRGRLADEDGAEELLATALRSIEVGKRLNVARLNVHCTGSGEDGLPVTPSEVVTGAMWLKARDVLSRLADFGSQHRVSFMLENLNLAVDLFDRSARAAPQPRPLSCADRRGELDRMVSQVSALDWRDPGRGRSRPERARYWRDQLSRRRPGAECHGLSRSSVHGSLRLRQPGGGASSLPRGIFRLN